MLNISETRTHQVRIEQKKIIGNRLRQARKDKGLTQKALCKKINICTGTLSDVENGNLTMTHTLDYHVKLICQDLNIPVSSIMDA